MDQFVTKTPRTPQEKNELKNKYPELKQVTIETMQGVVVIEDIKRLKVRLKLPDQSPSILLECLNELSQKIPPRNVLRSTKIGHTVHKLCTHSDEAVAKSANNVYKMWYQHFKELRDRPQIEVRCDAKTQTTRTNATKLLASVLGKQAGEGDCETHAKAIEQEVFYQSKRLVGVHYKRTIRTLVFKLKHLKDLRAQVFDKSVSTGDLVKKFKK